VVPPHGLGIHTALKTHTDCTRVYSTHEFGFSTTVFSTHGFFYTRILYTWFGILNTDFVLCTLTQILVRTISDVAHEVPVKPGYSVRTAERATVSLEGELSRLFPLVRRFSRYR
jgi:hypothetical protein